LGELVEVEHGWPFKSEWFSEDPQDPVVLAIGNFDYGGGFRFERSTVKRYSGDYPTQYRLSPGDIMLVMTCQTAGGEILGVPAVVPDDGQTYLHNQRIGRVVILRPADLDQRFFYHWARTPLFNRQLAATASGSKILHTAPGRIEGASIDLPPIGEQRAIADVLGALDDKIAANTAVVQAADALAATSLAKEVESSATSVPLSSLAEFVNGKAFTKDATGTGRVVIRIAELNSGIGGSTVYNDIEVAEKHLARPGDLLFAWSGSLTVHRWHRPEGIVNQHIFKVIPNDGYPLWLVNAVLRRKLADYRAIAADKATTMGHIQRHHLDERVRIPSPEDVGRLDAAMSALWDRALAAEVESLKLAETRDALLPLLMSGKVRVKDAEKVVEGVV
jgi:type I restriction enzyme S subunit